MERHLVGLRVPGVEHRGLPAGHHLARTGRPGRSRSVRHAGPGRRDRTWRRGTLRASRDRRCRSRPAPPLGLRGGGRHPPARSRSLSSRRGSVTPMTTVNVLLVTLDQFRGDCLSAAGHPLVRTPNLDALAARRCAVAPPLQPGGAVRARSGQPLHGHVPDEPSGRRQRHAARRPVRQRRARRPAGRLRTGAVRLHRPVARSTDREPGPTIRGCRRTTASCPASTRCSTSPTTTGHGSPGSPRSATTCRRGSMRPPGDRARAPGRAQRVGVPHRSRDRRGCVARTRRGSRTSATCDPTRRTRPPGSGPTRVRPGRRRRCRSRPPPSATRMHDDGARRSEAGGTAPTRPASATCGRSTTG